MKLLRKIRTGVFLALAIAAGGCSTSNLNMSGLMSGASKALQAATISDDQVRGYVHEYIAYSDKQNKVAPAGNKYAVRLARLTQGLNSVDGIPLNFKVYLTNDVNAFACADGSVRVYSGLMDRMTDDEVLGVIGHEIGHVAHKDTRKAFQEALLQSAVLDGIGSTSATAAALTNSQLSQIGQSLLSARYSQKQESNADDYGYGRQRRVVFYDSCRPVPPQHGPRHRRDVGRRRPRALFAPRVPGHRRKPRPLAVECRGSRAGVVPQRRPLPSRGFFKGVRSETSAPIVSQRP